MIVSHAFVAIHCEQGGEITFLARTIVTTDNHTAFGQRRRHNDVVGFPFSFLCLSSGGRWGGSAGGGGVGSSGRATSVTEDCTTRGCGRFCGACCRSGWSICCDTRCSRRPGAEERMTLWLLLCACYNAWLHLRLKLFYN